MKKLKITLLATTLLVLLSACTDKKDANKSNFKEVINKKLEKQCIEIGYSYRLFPVGIELKDYDKDKYDTLEKVGLIKSTAKQIEMYGSKKLVDGFEYDLTDLGKKAFIEEEKSINGKYLKLCAGKYKVTEIDNFTQPADMMGVKLVRVKFKKEAVDIPAWAYELVKEKSFENYETLISKDIKEDSTELILTNEGWILAKDFK